MKIYLAADHRGFKFKEKIKAWLGKRGYQVVDLGNNRYDPDDDYPDFAQKLGFRMAAAGNRLARQGKQAFTSSPKITRPPLGKDQDGGILFCGSGIGVDIVANRFAGIRCGLGFNERQVEGGRRDDDINCLALPADFLNWEEIKKIVAIFLKTKFDGKASHRRRIRKIDSR